MYSQRKKVTQNLEATQVMEMLMEHLFIQDLNQLLYLGNVQIVVVGGGYWILKDQEDLT